ncbi:MAG TPA: hypothetical protein VHA56_00315 [Mucilaginibacter sp.]|nr:hypothetical protein [Mucilaginibacter sp.]
MHLLSNEDELVACLEKAGYRPEYAEAMSQKLDGITDGSIIGLAETEAGKFWVDILYDVRPGNRIEITGLAACLHGQDRWQKFEGLPSARQVWQQLNQSQQTTEAIIKPLNDTIMAVNENNLQYNKNLLEKLGFGQALHDPLEKFIIQQQPEIKLTHEATHFRDNVEYTLHFRKSDTTDMYFFNRYEATLKNSEEAFNRSQSFHIRNGNNITAQEAFNLVAGRAVNKELFTGNGDRYEAWLKLDFSQKDKYGNYEVTQFHQNYGYDLDKALSKFPIRELADADQKGQLTASLKKGNLQQVTMQVEGKDTKMFIEANPRFRTLNIRDELGNTVKRERVEKKDLGKAEKLSEALGKDKTQKQGKSRGLSV